MDISSNINTDSQLLKILNTLIDDYDIRELLVKFYDIKRQYNPQIPQANKQQI